MVVAILQLNICILCLALSMSILSSMRSSCTPENGGECLIADSVIQEHDASFGLALLQKSVATLKKQSRSTEAETMDFTNVARGSSHSRFDMSGKPKITTTTTTATTTIITTTTPTSTTMAGIQDTLIISTNSEENHHIWTYGMQSQQLQYLIRGVGTNDAGIAFDNNEGMLYITMPGNTPGTGSIVRYELAIRGGQIMLYDYQPVPVLEGVDAEWITITETSDVMYSDPVTHTINKVYKTTLDLISKGTIQGSGLQTVDYVQFYEQYGPPPLALVDPNLTVYKRGYIFQVYTDVGHPSSMETFTDHTIMWGNLVDGFKRGTVVKAEAEPVPVNGKIPEPIALTHAWDSIFGFDIRPGNAETAESALFLTLNGTLGIPPIAGDVAGALVAIPSVTPEYPNPTSVVMAWDFKKPRGVALYRGSDDTVLVADDTGVTAMSSALIMEGGPQDKLFSMPGCAGLILVKNEDKAVPLMVGRGGDGLAGQVRDGVDGQVT